MTNRKFPSVERSLMSVKTAKSDCFEPPFNTTDSEDNLRAAVASVVAGAAPSGLSLSDMMRPHDVTAEGVAQALQLAGDALRLTTASADQLKSAVAFLAWARARLPDGAPRDSRRSKPVTRLERAGTAIVGELRRRAFLPNPGDRGVRPPARTIRRGWKAARAAHSAL
jgi:hypothetical protein